MFTERDPATMFYKKEKTAQDYGDLQNLHIAIPVEWDIKCCPLHLFW